ncbi:GNAT family N-acetyltransferase [Nostocoides vanveenii]|uniref:GNAT family N-acetyltransferase n=1 Tax=Nostocoides vanveenii TaxID=330835 RepID=A0ABN2K4U5_9MICO
MRDSGPVAASDEVRAVVRFRIEPAPPPGEPYLTDAVGTVIVNGPDEIVLATRRGRVAIPRRLVVATRIVPPAPPRRGVVGGELAPLELHREVADSWPPMERTQLGDWILRASRGFTSRGNSVVPVGDPGLPLNAALDAVESWYADRGLPANLTLADPRPSTDAAGVLTVDVSRDPVGALLIDRGYAVSDPSLFLTATPAVVHRSLVGMARVERGPAGRVTVQADRALTDAWLACYEGYRSNDAEAARAIMTGSPAQAFATALMDGRAVGVGRLGMSGSWGGLAAMWVDPAYRRSGVAQGMMGELVAAATDLGAQRLHLQVWAHNEPALALYRRLGFRVHHAYVNATG